MSVETSTDTALAGNDVDTAQNTPQEPAKQTRVRAPKAQRVVLKCDRCNGRLRGPSDQSGFAYVDLRDAHAAAQGQADKAVWSLAHTRCAPDVVAASLNPYFRIWNNRIATTDELLDTVAELSKRPWWAHSDWGALVRRILAETAEETSEQVDLERAALRAERAAQKAAQKAQRVLPPGDERHGTANGYTNWNCRCQPCTTAHEEYLVVKRERKRALRAAVSDQLNGLARDDD